MRISELSPDLRPPAAVSPSPSLTVDEIEAFVKEAERLSPDDLLAGKLSSSLQKPLSRLNSVHPLPESAKLHLWKLSYRLWNACVDLTNALEIRSQQPLDLRHKIAEENAKLRQISAELLLIAGPVAGIPSPAFKSASFFYKTGVIWHDLRKFDLAERCFERATDQVSKIAIERVSDAEEERFLLDLNIARSRTAWEISDRNVAFALLNRSKNLLFGKIESYKTLAEQYLQFGKFALSKDQGSKSNEALKLIEEAVDLCDKGSTVAKTLDLRDLRSRSLRFLAAAHLQREEFESVVRCVRVLREGGATSGEHASVGFLAMKAWLGMGRCGEAEKELRGMVVNKEVPEGVCVSAVEAFFEGAGAAGAEAVKGIFLGMMGRCHVSAGSAVRVVQRLAAGGGGGEGGRMMAKVVAELVADERVVALFAGDGKDRWAMHAVLWNSGAEFFRSKDYEVSAEMFEKSMLYVLHDVENRILRAKSFRVLCLCHLGLSQLDRAEEYINEAQKLDPNIACAFFKLKICLQKKDESAAIKQVQSMLNCLDFNPEFLTLSAHEAMACQSLPVAAAALSTLLDLYAPEKPMPMPEVAVLRSLVAILFHGSNNEHEILRCMNRARTRMAELGTEKFFGDGAVGSRELNWFAGNSWNMGIKTGKEKKYDISSQVFMLASEFYGVMGGEADRGSLAMVCKSLILSVSSMITNEKEKDAILEDSDVKRGVELLDRAGKILTLMSTTTQPTDDRATIDPSFFFLHTFNSYHLCRRLDNSQSQQLHLIKSFASSKHCTPQHLLQMGLAASQGPHPNPEAAHFALNSCLTALIASPVPDYQVVALVIRKLIMLAGIRNGDAENEAYAMYRHACRILVGLKEGEYPAEEGKWLATTAWNRSVLPGRLGQMDAAMRWMKIGLELARHVHNAGGYKECMEECIARIEKLESGGGV
ncbi:TPR repeat-containing protein ZIP4 [Cinnamomum micranthum f. kanehirae]|uniref:Protein ZIP4 homolog n=1 Tax=Cinnamomum micranthum f. kanehirae TaxID=337451 RepID=A0A3S3MK10_9MAGN|nr:TPR repeat-containing protein ZIP4 [Cinnamomum micranthum f. kanehirae]